MTSARDDSSDEARKGSAADVAQAAEAIDELDVGLDRDGFMRRLIRELSGSLQEIVGLDEAAGFIDIVGQSMGARIGEDYRAALGVESLSRSLVPEILVDLKRRIGGDFYVIEADDEKIVLGNRRCPFGDEMVAGRPALCRMTSNVFGTIAAENLGYGKVEIQEAIAQGDPGCRVVVHLQPTPEAQKADGREYFKTG